MQEAEGARGRDLAAEAFRRKREREALLPDGGGREGDLEIENQGIGGSERGACVLVRHFHALQHLDRAAGRRLLLDARLVDQGQIAQRVAVQDRRLGPVQDDQKIVDLGPRDGRHQMLDHVHLGAGGRQHRSKIGFGDGVVSRRNFGAVQIGPAEDDSGAGIGRRQHHAHLGAGVKGDAFGSDFAGDGVAHRHGSQNIIVFGRRGIPCERQSAADALTTPSAPSADRP